MANPLLKLLGELPSVPDFSIIGEQWLWLVYDPATKVSYKATSIEVRKNLVPPTLFGTEVPGVTLSSIVGGIYWRHVNDSTIELYYRTTVGWELKETFGNYGEKKNFSATKQFTATCGVGSTGNPVTREASRTSSISQADADALALNAAKTAAEAALICTVVAKTYTSTKEYTARCAEGTTGNPVTKSSTYVSAISQADADAKALAEAKRLALQDLVCTIVAVTPPAPSFISYDTVNRTATIAAPSGYQITDVDYRVNGGSALAVPSNGVLFVGAGAVAAGNLVIYVRQTSSRNKGVEAASTVSYTTGTVTPQPITYTSTKSYTATCGGGTTGSPVSKTATRTSTISQADADSLALNAATSEATAALVCTPVASNQLPQVTAFSVSSSAITAGQPITFTLSAIDPDGTVPILIVQEGSEIVETATGPSGTTPPLTPSQGTHEYTAYCVDDKGVKSLAFPTKRTVTVSAAPVVAPTFIYDLTGPEDGHPEDGTHLQSAPGDVFSYNPKALGDGTGKRAVVFLPDGNTEVCALDFLAPYLTRAGGNPNNYPGGEMFSYHVAATDTLYYGRFLDFVASGKLILSTVPPL